MIDIGKLKDLIVFPTHMTFKVIGDARESLLDDVYQVSSSIVTEESTAKREKSKTGKYDSISINVYVTNIEQVEKLYTEFGKITGVKVVL